MLKKKENHQNITGEYEKINKFLEHVKNTIQERQCNGQHPQPYVNNKWKS